jgi:hypothetical protein
MSRQDQLDVYTKAEAEAWVTFNIDNPDSSETASVGKDSEDSGSNTNEDVIPARRLHTSTEPLFDFVSQDPSGRRMNCLELYSGRN